MQRKTLLKKRFLRQGLDGILITDLTNVRYLTGFSCSSGYIVITKKHDVFATDFRYQEQAEQQVEGFILHIERGERSREIGKIAEELNVRRLGFEDHNVTYAFHKKLLKKGIRLKPLTSAVETMRAIKSDEEIAFIRKAVHRAERAFRKLIPHIKPGVTELSLNLKFEGLLKAEGCKSLPFGIIIVSGPLSSLPHARPSGRRIGKGDFIIFDWGGEYNGYFSDMTRTVLIRDKDISRQKKIYHTVLEAQKRAIDSARANVKASLIDAAARDYIKAEGHGEHFGHGTGHGIGLVVHEKPSLSWRSKDVIRENMVFTIEPGIYIPGFGGVRIEDMVVAKKGGVEVLTSLPKKLMVI